MATQGAKASTAMVFARIMVSTPYVLMKYMWFQCHACPHYSDVTWASRRLNHQPLECLFNKIFEFGLASKKHQRPTLLILCEGNPQVTDGFPHKCEVSVLWRHFTGLKSLQWRHNVGVSNHQPHDCLLNDLFRRRSKKTSKLRGTGLCAGNSPVTGEFPAQRASNAENVSIWWRHHVLLHPRGYSVVRLL